MGFGRQDGRFACVEVETGKTLWEAPIQATVSETASCDVDGDGRAEFVFGTSHGEVVCLRPGRRGAGTVWRVRTGGWTGAPVIADIDGDRLPEIIVPVSDGTLTVLKGATGRPAQRAR
jgi:outer membrane protein assembly factor BamB